LRGPIGRRDVPHLKQIIANLPCGRQPDDFSDAYDLSEATIKGPQAAAQTRKIIRRISNFHSGDSSSRFILRHLSRAIPLPG
jgi:hypothetical protein